MDSSEESVRVAARFRPIIELEEDVGYEGDYHLEFGADEKKVSLERQLPAHKVMSRTFSLDWIFGPETTQEYLFHTLCEKLVLSVLQGYNGTIFAYGQTGSGKTYSMFGDVGDQSMKGIIPRAAELLFSELKTNEGVQQMTMKCSMLEIYKEVVRDVLSKAPKTHLKVRETPRGAVRVVGLTEEWVTSPTDVVNIIQLGMSRRTTARTALNDASSRSHVLLTLTITQKMKDATVRVGKLHLGDLAGSERVGKSDLGGSTLEEAKQINKSLSALGNCILALTSKSATHVPFRDSKLTFILKDALGGNTKTCLLVTCSPHARNFEETVSSLKFGARAKNIKNTVRINQQLNAHDLRALVGTLRKQLAQTRAAVRNIHREQKMTGTVSAEMIQKLLKGNLEGIVLDAEQKETPKEKTEEEQKEESRLMEKLGLSGEVLAQVSSLFGAMNAKDVEELLSTQNLQNELQEIISRRKVMGGSILHSASNPSLNQIAAIESSTNIAGDGLQAQLEEARKRREQFKSEMSKHRLWAVEEEEEDIVEGEEDKEVDLDADEDSESMQRKKLLQEQIRMAQKHLEHLEKRKDVDLDRILETERLTQELSGRAVSPNAEAPADGLQLTSPFRARSVPPGSPTSSQPEISDLEYDWMIGNLPGIGDLSKLSNELLHFSKEQTKEGKTSMTLPSKFVNHMTKLLSQISSREKVEGAGLVSKPEEDKFKFKTSVGSRTMSTDQLKEALRKKEKIVFDYKPPTRSKEAVEKQKKRSGMVEYQIDLLPSPEEIEQGITEPLSLGFLEVQSSNVTLKVLRRLIEEELDDLPEAFIFTRNAVPIGRRQETRRTVAYIADVNDTIRIRPEPEPK